MSKHCRSCGEPLSIETKLENKVGTSVNVYLPCLRAAINELKHGERHKYYGLESIDI